LGNCNCGDGEPLWRVFVYQRYIVYSIYGIRYFMILVYVLSVIMMKYTISCTEIRYLVNRSWHTVCCVLYTKFLSATQYSSEYLSIMLMFHPLNHNHYTKEAFMCHSVPVSICALNNPLHHSIHYRNATKQTANQTLACSQTT
jgi:hypothetical protein